MFLKGDITLNENDHELRNDGYIYEKNTNLKLPIKCLGDATTEIDIRVDSLEDVSVGTRTNNQTNYTCIFG